MPHAPGALFERREIRHFHLLCGLGGGARGFNRGSARVGDQSQSAKYQALNKLVLRGIFPLLEAYKDDMPELLLFEIVPRIANRGRRLERFLTPLNHRGFPQACFSDS